MTTDLYLNEIFESLDPRDGGKRIRVIGKATSDEVLPRGLSLPACRRVRPVLASSTPASPQTRS